MRSASDAVIARGIAGGTAAAIGMSLALINTRSRF